MTMRSRFSDSLSDRLRLTNPSLLETVWGAQNVVCVVESLKFLSAQGCHPGVKLVAEFNGVFRAQLHADTVDAIDFTQLLANLIDKPIVLAPDFGGVGSHSQQVRAQLIEMRDALNERELVASLRFEVMGAIVVAVEDDPAPTAWYSFEPYVGEEFEGNYQAATS